MAKKFEIPAYKSWCIIILNVLQMVIQAMSGIFTRRVEKCAPRKLWCAIVYEALVHQGNYNMGKSLLLKILMAPDKSHA